MTDRGVRLTSPATYRTVLKRPEGDARSYTLVVSGSNLQAIQAVVGGYIELLGRVPRHSGVICYVNEEGRLHELPYNFTCGFGRFRGERVVGPAIFVGETDEGDLRDLTEAEVSAVLAMFGKEIVAP